MMDCISPSPHTGGLSRRRSTNIGIDSLRRFCPFPPLAAVCLRSTQSCAPSSCLGGRRDTPHVPLPVSAHEQPVTMPTLRKKTQPLGQVAIIQGCLPRGRVIVSSLEAIWTRTTPEIAMYRDDSQVSKTTQCRENTSTPRNVPGMCTKIKQNTLFGRHESRSGVVLRFEPLSEKSRGTEQCSMSRARVFLCASASFEPGQSVSAWQVPRTMCGFSLSTP